MTVLSSRAAISDVRTDVVERLARALGDDVEVTTRVLDRVAVAIDASHYLATPQALARPRTAAQVATAMAIAVNAGWPLTMRAGGSSLSGQALSEGLTLDVRRHFRDIEVLDNGARVRVQPGATVRQVNAQLARHRTKLGPDPASEIACTIGGMIANNSSGMTCGTTANTYRTIESMTVVLPSGTVVDTGAPDADARLRADEPALVEVLETLRDQLRRPEMRADIERRWAIKNTMGYGMNSFVDFDQPVKILEHLLVGSEGTLGFIAEAYFRTVPVHPKTATGFLLFNSLDAATDALPTLVNSGADVVELVDSAAILAMGKEAESVLPKGMEVKGQASLLVEYQGDTDEELAERSKEGLAHFGDFDLYSDPEMTQDPKRRTEMWTMRQGLYTKVARNRPKGTAALLEDIAVPMERLGNVCSELQVLFDRHHYKDAVIFGHAKNGNIHFLVTEDFAGPESMKRYEDFTEDMVQLVLGKQGTLKAEHGTGRIMAPFVHRQYGDELYDAMWQVKRACDPTVSLNPGAVLTEDPKLHLKNIKKTVPVRPVIDDCVECGYCEPVCPSQHLTTTPRQRIVVQRAIAAAQASGDQELAKQLYEQETYSVVQTCAVDGMCQTACPVKINTGDLIRDLRAERAPGALDSGWAFAAEHWSGVLHIASAGMTVVDHVPNPLVRGVLGAARAIGSKDVIPTLSAELPGGGPIRKPRPAATPQAVFMPACVGSMFGTGYEHGSGVREAVLKLADLVGYQVEVPEGIGGLCCATPWKSKGLHKGGDIMGHRLAEVLGRASDNGRLPVICDNVSCSEGTAIALHKAGVDDIRVIDATTWAAEFVAPRLPELHKDRLAVVHPTCSSTRMGVNEALIMLAGLVADQVVVPDGLRCCAFAGDRGLLHPELTASSTRDEAASVAKLDAQLYLSCNRTCEIGMTRATGKTYVHVLEVVADRATAGQRATVHA
ncbi:FAD-binding and (Fe-S)-binding domain-containing protein [Brooklawnia cerclae]|uniref:D-lactate dehydrogenase (cytochrome) n=1 Tax=Brooklawnia cerclae TaxID=349934 RepID=A0ABX0SH05_9ACTN|nr:FAD-binding and (Fe-S)-binding domain-containing protein [Brooklawnia cerclae]NIH56016.1 D-lactate dehydrogenase [Brooklawnia cerclae]